MEKWRLRAQRLERGAAFAVMLLCFALTAYYLIAGYGAFLDADMSSELALAQHLAQEGALVSPGWHYSTEIRLLSTQLVYTPLMALFPGNWRLVRTLGCLILLALLAGAAYLAGRMCGAARAYAGLFAGLIVCPVSPLYAQNMVIGAYYVPHAALTLLTLALFAGFIRGKRRRLCAALLAALAMGMGMSSVRYLLCALIPLFGAALWQAVFAADEEAPGTVRRYLPLLPAAAAALCGAAGYLFAQKVLAGKLSWGSDYYGSMGFASLAESDLGMKAQQALLGLLEILGFEDGALLFSVSGVLNALILLALFVCTLLLARLLAGARRAQDAQGEAARFAGLMFMFAAGLTAALFLLVASLYIDRYWIPVLALAAPVLAAALSRERNAPFRVLAAAVLCAAVLLPSAVCVKYSMRSPQAETDKRMAAVSAARELGYMKGYATFWNANIVTELSDGEIEVVSLQMLPGDGEKMLAPYRWLEAEANFAMDRPEEPVFLLLGSWEEAELSAFLARAQAVRHELDGWIHLYEIPSQRLLFEAMGL